MLDVKTSAAPTAQDLARARIALRAAKVGDRVAELVLRHAAPETAVLIGEAVAAGYSRLTAAVRTYFPTETDAETQALRELDTVLGSADTDPTDIPQAVRRHVDAMHAARVAKQDRSPTRGEFLVGNSFDGGNGARNKMVMALTKRLDPKLAEKSGYTDAAMDVSEIAMACCRAAGIRPFNVADAVQRASHTTSDFPLILDGTVGNLVARDMGVLQPSIRAAAHEVLREDYRAGRNLELSATSKPTEIGESGEIKFVTVDEKGELLPKLRDFGSGLMISNQVLANDSTAVGLMSQIAAKMANGAVATYRDVLVAPLLENSGAGQTMADGVVMFHAAHGNLAASGTLPSIASLSVARTAMRRQKGMRGEIRAIQPWALLVPPELETVAEQLVADLAAASVGEVNPFHDSLQIIVEAGLTSTTAWYLLANPGMVDGLAVGFMNGMRTPRIESRPAWSTLGLELRLIWALDAKFVETATWYRNPGA